VWAKPDLLVSTIAQSNPIPLLAAFCAATLVIFLRVFKWKVLVEGLGFKDAALTQLAGMTVDNFTPGKIGEPVKSLLLKQRTGVAVSASLPAIVWERILDVVIMVAFAITGFWAVSFGPPVQVCKDSAPQDPQDFNFTSTFGDFTLDDDGGADPRLHKSHVLEKDISPPEIDIVFVGDGVRHVPDGVNCFRPTSRLYPPPRHLRRYSMTWRGVVIASPLAPSLLSP